MLRKVRGGASKVSPEEAMEDNYEKFKSASRGPKSRGCLVNIGLFVFFTICFWILAPILLGTLERIIAPYISTTVSSSQSVNNIDIPGFFSPIPDYILLPDVENQLKGAEAFVQMPDGRLFTSLYDGRIVQIIERPQARYITVARTGVNVERRCATPMNEGDEIETSCSRPLGLVVGGEDLLYVADAWRGLLAVDVSDTSYKVDWEGKQIPLSAEESKAKNDQIRKHFTNADYVTSSNVKVLAQLDEFGKRLVFADGIAKHDNHIYFTGLTNQHFLDLFVFEFFQPKFGGRLYRYDIQTGKVETLYNDLVLPNGLTTTFDGQGLLMVAGGDQLWRYGLEGPSKGKLELFVQKLGVMGDNITKHRKLRTYFFTGNSDRTLLLDQLINRPQLRTLFRNIMPLALHKWLLSTIPSRWTTIEIGEFGNVIGSFGLHTGHPRVSSVSEFFQSKSEYAYVGCYSAICRMIRFDLPPSADELALEL